MDRKKPAAGWGLLAGLAVAVCATLAAADESDSSGPALSSYTPSAGKQGSPLKWVPYRSQSGRLPQPIAADRFARATAAAPTKAGPREIDDPMSDPWGDSKPKTRSPAPPESPPDDVIGPLPAPPRPMGPGSVLPGKAPAKGPSSTSTNGDSKPARTFSSQQPVKLDKEKECALVQDEGIDELTPDLKKRPRKGAKVEDDMSDTKGVPLECELKRESDRDWRLPRGWAATTFTWKASGLCQTRCPP
jgi:hypothetical protein